MFFSALKSGFFALLAGLSLSLTATAQVDDGPSISALGVMDRHYMNAQRTLVDELTRSNYGSAISGDKNRDLRLLQRLLDDGLVKGSQTRELQAMGIVMGDLLAADLGMDWVVYEDPMGRSRALRYKETDLYLFPATMISRRREVNNLTPVVEIYDKAYNTIDRLREPLPFQ